ncbi:MAG TPA: envelope biogenesis factor ElyC [Victivallales bacterium]|nr:envelope biogenesis factor ElyC [Victivallales bacterium]
MFIFKKIISAFLMPLPAGLIIIVIGLLFLWLTRKQKTGKVIVTLGTIILLVFSYSGIPNLLIGKLENSYSAFNQPDTSIKYIVVLNGGVINNHNIYTHTQPSVSSLARVAEGVILYRTHPGSKIVFTGGSFKEGVPPQSLTLAKFAQKLGVDKVDIITSTKSMDTKDEAKNIRDIVGNNRFILVTSAYHMRRALNLFVRQGLHPVPAPAGYLVNELKIKLGLPFELPSARNLQKSDFAVHEYLGLLWAKLNGQI